MSGLRVIDEFLFNYDHWAMIISLI